MPVNLAPPKAGELLPVKGLALGVAEAGVRKANRKDLLVLRLVCAEQLRHSFIAHE